MVVTDRRQEEVVQTLAKSPYSGRIGNGKMFVRNIADEIRFRNGNDGNATL